MFDPSEGSGTTYITAEVLNRRWAGIELGPFESIVQRFNDLEFHQNYIREIQSKKNVLFTEELKKLRLKMAFGLLKH